MTELLENLPKCASQEFKDAWVAALRSGHYRQGCGVLYDEVADAHCCLGVALRVGIDTGLIPPSQVELTEYFLNRDNMPRIRHPLWEEGGTLMPLAFRNDGNDIQRHTFDEIADIIEEWM